ncbi:MAG: hypothetical protein U1E65_18550 [Myxococcota bacterium]
MNKLHRRQLLKLLGLSAAGASGAVSALLHQKRAVAQTAQKPYFLIVIPAAGGASIIDGPLAIREGESPNAMTINAFPDAEVVSVANSPFRAVNLRRNAAGPIPFPFTTNQEAFVTKHKDDMMAVTVTGTSVNHRVAQKRSLTGNEAWHGRTLQEAVAAQYGAGYPLPNVNMAVDGYIEHGNDPSLPTWARHEPVSNASVWPLGLDGAKGIKDLPSRALIERARALRNQDLDSLSPFAQTFEKSSRLKLWNDQRSDLSHALEMQDLITKLMILPNNGQIPLTEYGLLESPDGQKVRAKFPNFLTDPLEAEAALAFLLIKNKVSVSVSISPSFGVLLAGVDIRNPPLAFDFSHNAHRAAQGIMWKRIMNIADGLIDLLSAEEFDSATGESYWDRTLIYVATEFGRDKARQGGADDFGTGHHLNNGYLIVSPLANGNHVLGGVDPATGLTYGFDPTTGAPDTHRNMTEAEIYSGILGALKVDTSAVNLPDVRAMRKTA